MAKLNRIRWFHETLRAVLDGVYRYEGTPVTFHHSYEEHRAITVFSARTVHDLIDSPRPITPRVSGEPCIVEVTDEDSYVAAQSMLRDLPEGAKPPLVLNFANPHHPGGGVTRGARAQEEDLCRRSTLYVSINSAAAEPYYQENKALSTNLFADNASLTPHVEVFRDRDVQFLPEPFEVSVITMAAPFVPFLKADEVELLPQVFERRIEGLLHLAAMEGYTQLVLGAWGCGAFYNDPTMVAGAFRTALTRFAVPRADDPSRTVGAQEIFERVRFAIPAGPNHSVFARELAGFSFAE